MVVDKLECCNLYLDLAKGIEKAFKYLQVTDFGSEDAGKYVIEGDRIYALINDYEVSDIKDGQFEVHQKYIDIQYLVSGSENIGYAPLLNVTVTREYDEVHDYALYKGENASLLSMNEGMMAIFMPEELHMPGVGSSAGGNVRKVVVKVRVE